MANTYTYLGPGTRWAAEDPTSVDRLNLARQNADHLHEALNTLTNSTTLDGILSVADGAAATPSVTNTGDLNTGMWFPAADTIAWSTGGTEALRIDGSQAIGIGGANYGTDGQVLTSGGAGAAPAWESPTTGDITGVTAGTGLSGGGASGSVTLTVAAAQTGITSLLATDIKIGEDDQTKIDFGTANEIHFYADNAVKLATTAVGADTLNGATAVKHRIFTSNTGAAVAVLEIANSSGSGYNDGMRLKHGAGYTLWTDLGDNNGLKYTPQSGAAGLFHFYGATSFTGLSTITAANNAHAFRVYSATDTNWKANISIEGEIGILRLFPDGSTDGSGPNFVASGSGQVFIGGTSNDNMTQGLTIKQAAGIDNQALTLKSGDVVHGITVPGFETDDFCVFAKHSGDGGGVRITGISDDHSAAVTGIALQPIAGQAADTTKSTSGIGILHVKALIKNGTDAGAPAANSNLMTVANYTATQWLVDAEGDTWQNGGATFGGKVGVNADPIAWLSFNVQGPAGNSAAAQIIGTSSSHYPMLEIENTTGNCVLRIDCNTGSGDAWDCVSNTDGNFSINNADNDSTLGRVVVTPAGLVAIGDTENANMTNGLTINQVGNDNQIFCLKANERNEVCPVLESGTAASEADDFFFIRKVIPTKGGAYLTALGNDDLATPMRIETWGGPPGTADTTSSDGAINIFVGEHNGSNADVDMAANSNALVIGEINSSGVRVTRFILKADDGELHLGNSTPVALDFEDDNQLVRAMQRESAATGIIDSEYDNPFYNYNKLYEHGLAGEKDEDGFFLFPVQSRLGAHEGALWQNYCAIKDTHKNIAELREELDAKDNRILALEAQIDTIQRRLN